MSAGTGSPVAMSLSAYRLEPKSVSVAEAPETGSALTDVSRAKVPSGSMEYAVIEPVVRRLVPPVIG